MDGERLSFSGLDESSGASVPEVSLAVAVLHRAVLDCVTNGIPAPMRRSAYFYLTSGDRAWPFSFLNVAEFFCEDAEHFRERVLRFIRETVGHDDLGVWLKQYAPKERYRSGERRIPEEERAAWALRRPGRGSAAERLRYCRGTRGVRPKPKGQ